MITNFSDDIQKMTTTYVTLRCSSRGQHIEVLNSFSDNSEKLTETYKKKNQQNLHEISTKSKFSPRHNLIILY